MITRVLPPDEWSRLEGTEAGPLWTYLDPQRAEVLVVEEDGQIIGSWVLINMLHAECLWVAPAHRGRSAVLRRLFTGLVRVMTGGGIPTVWTASASPAVTAMLDHLGAQKIPGDHYAMRTWNHARDRDRHRSAARGTVSRSPVRDPPDCAA